jgi:hypothetical protein
VIAAAALSGSHQYMSPWRMNSCTSGSARIVTTVALATVGLSALSRSAKSNVIATKSVALSAVR